jgi:TonB-linked SusC/RagA family outer membrane protein
LAEAQPSVITGTVTSESGQALVGANVYINDLQLSASTNAQGTYTITIPSARCCGQQVNLRVRALGYRPETRPLRVAAGTSTINFAMKQDINRLDEIVVTGTIEGTERAKVPFAVSRLTTGDLPVPALDPLRALAGKMPGVRIAQSNGRPGETPEILMRGPTSLNGENRGQGPLIIVDGAIMNVGSLEELGGLDIESVEVVKGAAGASLYGTRAAKGVITIKTKRGATGQEGIKFSARNEYGFNDMSSLSYGQPVNHHITLDETGTRFCILGGSGTSHCSQTIDWNTEIMRINAVKADTARTAQRTHYANPAAGSGQLQNVFQSSIWPGRYYNTFAQWTTPNPVTLNQLDATGRLGGVRFYASGSYQDEAGAVKGVTGVQQARGRINLDYDVRSDLLVSMSTLFDRGWDDRRNGAQSGDGFGGLLRGAPAGTNYLATDSLGRYIFRGGSSNLRGPTNGAGAFMWRTQNNLEWDQRYTNRFLGSVGTSYFPREWVTVEGNIAFDTRYERQDHWRQKGFRTPTAEVQNNFGRMQLSDRQDNGFNAGIGSTFRRELATDLNGKLNFRAAYEQSGFYDNNVFGEQFLVKEIYDLDNLKDINSFDPTSSRQTTKNQGLSAGGSLDYKDRYIFDASFRRDGSSRFGSAHRWANFGRVSGVWRVSEESFWTVPYVSDFRIRASRGTAGSTPQFSAQYETYSVTTAGVSLGQAGNSKLRPETTTETEVGTDFTLFNRLGVEVTYAHANTKDQILEVATPASLGFSTQWQNAGTLQNKTWELGLNLPVLTRQDLQWNMRGTWDRTRTFITELFVPKFTYTPTAQGSGSFFQIQAEPYRCRYSAPLPAGEADDCTPPAGITAYSVTNGHKANRFGNIWGRKFLKSCADLNPKITAAVASGGLGMTCGNGALGDVSDFQVNDWGYLVWTGAGNNWRDGITRNLWQTILPGTASPFGNTVPLYFGMPIVDRPLRGESGAGVGILQILGNVMPDFRFGWSNNVTYKRFNVYALLEGTIGHELYNQSEQWGLFDYTSSTFDMGNKTVETAKPQGYQWRTGPSEGAGIGGFYDILNQNNYNTEDASYAKIRELSASYSIGPVRGIGDWTVGVVGRNLFTFTDYTGYDPESGASGTNTNTGSGLINQVDRFDYPTLRTFTFTLATRF